MRHAHTVAQVRAAEQVLLDALPPGTLMQRAATGLAHAVIDLLGGAYGRRVVVLVGSGDNGGDALYAGAVLARRGALVEAVLLDPSRAHTGGLAAFRAAGGRTTTTPAQSGDNERALGGQGERTRGTRSAHSAEVVIDGITGIGGRPGLRPEAVAACRALGVPVAGTDGHRSRVRGAAPAGETEREVDLRPLVPVQPLVVAVDLPSGVDADTGRLDGAHVRADVTVTFGTHKLAHLVDPAAEACGVVQLVDIGLDLPPAAVTSLQPEDVAALTPVPGSFDHKYTRGVVGVRAGSSVYPGAGLLCVAGAGAGLAGMVRYRPVDDERAVNDIVRAAHPEVVAGEGRVQAWVVGSGGGDRAGRALAEALADDVPVVVDADALAAVTAPLGVPAILTPHAGELARMLDLQREEIEADPLRHARTAAQRFGAVVMLKGRHTLTAHPDGRVRVTTTGVPWLATAGAGDVLAGVTGALLAAGLDPFDAASAGSWLHGAAATLAADGGPLTAGAVARALPEAVRRVLAAGNQERAPQPARAPGLRESTA